MSAVGQLETLDIPHAISVVRLIADIFLFYEKERIIHRGIKSGNSPQHEHGADPGCGVPKIGYLSRLDADRQPDD